MSLEELSMVALITLVSAGLIWFVRSRSGEIE